MRLIRNIPHELYQISIFEWNNKYIVKVESGPYEQSYKIDVLEIEESDIPFLINKAFMQTVTQRFNQMHQDFSEAMDNIGNEN